MYRKCMPDNIILGACLVNYSLQFLKQLEQYEIFLNLLKIYACIIYKILHQIIYTNVGHFENDKISGGQQISSKVHAKGLLAKVRYQ